MQSVLQKDRRRAKGGRGRAATAASRVPRSWPSGPSTGWWPTAPSPSAGERCCWPTLGRPWRGGPAVAATAVTTQLLRPAGCRPVALMRITLCVPTPTWRRPCCTLNVCVTCSWLHWRWIAGRWVQHSEQRAGRGWVGSVLAAMALNMISARRKGSLFRVLHALLLRLPLVCHQIAHT